MVCERRYALMRARRSFNHHKRTTNGPQAARLDVCAHVRREPHGGIFANPRSCFGFCFEIVNVVLHSVRKCNSHTPA